MHRILKPGHNCWRIERSEKVAFLIDGNSYFYALHSSILQAQRSILILAWDIDSRFRLIRDKSDTSQWPDQVCDLLNAVVKRRRKLHAYVLDWDVGMIYGANREFLPIYKFDWKTHHRLQFYLDNQHPVGASQHQKVVVIDDVIAFAGGLDITKGRWDTSEHLPNDLRRCDDKNHVPRPYHDVQMAVSGKVAASLGDLARQRWLCATGKRITPSTTLNDPWPPEIKPDMTDVDVAIVRTEPRFHDRSEIREVEKLYLDAIQSARRLIYIENQYFTAGRIADALARRLKDKDGPEVVLLLPLKTDGWLAQNTMDVMRDRLIRFLKLSDQYNRFKVYYPFIPNQGDQVINLHAKVMIIDDELMRIGSSNLNNRSMGLDSECDLAIEACGVPRIQHGIATLRNRLLSEHLDTTQQEVTHAVKENSSVIEAIEALSGAGRSLKPLPLSKIPEPDVLVTTKDMIDPEHPIDPDDFIRQYVHDRERPLARFRIGWWSSALLIILMFAMLWRWSPLHQWMDIETVRDVTMQIKEMSAAPLIMLFTYLIASILAFPLTILIIVTILVFGSWPGFIYAFFGAMLGALGSYLLGYLLGRNTVRKIAGTRLNELNYRLAQRGLIAIITLRIIPVAPFTVINFVAGASHIRFRDYFLGTLIGMMPGIVAITLFTDRIIASISTPSMGAFISLAIVVALIIVTAMGLYHWLGNRLRVKHKDR